MVPPPIALGLVLCQGSIIEEKTRNVTLVNTFVRHDVEEFPSPPQRFTVFSVITDGQGDATIDLVVTRLATGEEIFAQRVPWNFPNRLTEVRLLYKITQCRFPAPGLYQVTILVDGDWIAQRRFQAALREV
jgi:hypothetical protein